MKSPEQIEHKLLNIQQMRTLKQNGSWPEAAEYQHTARIPEPSVLNEAKPPSRSSETRTRTSSTLRWSRSPSRSPRPSARP